MKNEIMIWGLGNELYGDDAVGIVISENLRQNPPAGMTIYTCYTVPGNYIAAINREGPSKLILIDASDMGIRPGEFRRFRMNEISDVSFTNHDMPLEIMLAPFDLDIEIIGVQPERAALGAPITEKVMSAAVAIERILRNGDIETIQRL